MYFGERMANCRHFPSFHTFFYFFFSYILNLSRDQLYLIHFFFFPGDINAGNNIHITTTFV